MSNVANPQTRKALIIIITGLTAGVIMSGVIWIFIYHTDFEMRWRASQLLNPASRYPAFVKLLELPGKPPPPVMRKYYAYTPAIIHAFPVDKNGSPAYIVLLLREREITMGPQPPKLSFEGPEEVDKRKSNILAVWDAGGHHEMTIDLRYNDYLVYQVTDSDSLELVVWSSRREEGRSPRFVIHELSSDGISVVIEVEFNLDLSPGSGRQLRWDILNTPPGAPSTLAFFVNEVGKNERCIGRLNYSPIQNKFVGYRGGADMPMRVLFPPAD
jgi:hypothetical protein